MKFRKVVTFGLKENADVNSKKSTIKNNLPGKFNEYNFLAAKAAVELLGVTEKEIEKSISDFKLPQGRLQEIYSGKFKYIVDFAHTPNSFLQLLSFLRPEVKGRIIHVFGSAGKRDEEKRPKMGKISSSFADVIILTAEDPRNEPTSKISTEIATGIKRDFKLLTYKNYDLSQGKKKIFFEIDNRIQAINFAVSIAEKDDLVVSTGKGHEASMNYGKGEEPWNESEVALDAIKKYEKK
jgi:UDP-N-acetylmuramoyl-L-alanyl-D-glutamate--2,6-diaminopimelate ligase